MEKPILQLRVASNRNKSVLSLNYSRNPILNQIIRSSPHTVFNEKEGKYCIDNTSEAIFQLREHLKEVADVNIDKKKRNTSWKELEGKPIIYLTKNITDEKVFIEPKFDYRNNTILTRVRQQHWIKFDKETKAFLFEDEALMIRNFIDSFIGIAIVNIQRLDQPIIEASSLHLIKPKQRINRKAKFKLEVKLFGSRIEQEDRIYFSYRHHPIIDKILKIKCVKDTLRNAYFIPANPLKTKEVLEELLAIAKVKVNDSLKISSVDILKMLLEQSYDKTRYKLCPIAYLEIMHARNLSLKTMRTYHHYLIQFLNEFPSMTISQINELESIHINEYHRKMAQSGVSFGTLNQSINSIKFYFKHVVEKELNQIDLKRPIKEKTLPTLFSSEEINEILHNIDNLKHKCILLTIYSAGLRVGELLSLKKGDLDFDHGYLWVRGGKGKKDRRTLLSENLKKLLITYLSRWKPKEWLFEGQYGGRYSATSARVILKRAMKKVGISKKASLHSLRHSFATHLLEKGTDIRYIQELLGHNSSKTTEIYTYVSNKYISSIKSPADYLQL